LKKYKQLKEQMAEMFDLIQGGQKTGEGLVWVVEGSSGPETRGSVILLWGNFKILQTDCDQGQEKEMEE
jgi:hypothetical protein